jgi:hypothetical protein
MAHPFAVNRDPLGFPPYGGSPSVPGVGPTAGQTVFARPYVSSAPGALHIEEDHGSNYMEQGKSRVTYTYAVYMNQDDDEAGDTLHTATAPGHLVFARHTKMRMKHSSHVTDLMTLSSVNHFLRSEHGRREFGKDLTAARVLEMFKWIGVQQTDTQNANVYGRRAEAALTIFVAQRAVVPDVWLASGVVARNGDHCYLLLRRFTMDEDAKEDLEFALNERNGPAARLAAQRKTVTRAIMGQNGAAPKTYWAFVPYVSRDRAAPAAAYYHSSSYMQIAHAVELTITEESEESSWCGAALFIGVATDRINTVENKDRFVMLASRCMYPLTLGDNFEMMNKLPKLELSLRAL